MIDWSLVGSIAASVVALGSLGVSVVMAKRAQLKNDVKAYTSELKTWHKETLAIMKYLYVVQEMLQGKLSEPMKERYSELRGKLISDLSTQIDVGRDLFFNVEQKNYAQNKPDLYKGKRVVVLDLLVMYHHMFKENMWNKEREPIRKNIERAFNSEVLLFNRTLRKGNSLKEYNLVDETDLLLDKNILDSKFKEVLTNTDLVQAVKTRNEEHEKHVKEETKATKDNSIVSYFRNHSKDKPKTHTKKSKKQEESVVVVEQEQPVVTQKEQQPHEEDELVMTKTK